MNLKTLRLAHRVAVAAMDNAQQVLDDYKNSATSKDRSGLEAVYEKDVADAIELLYALEIELGENL